MSLATLTPPEVIPAPRELIAVTIMQAVAEAFPRARQRRRFIAVLADVTDRLDGTASVVEIAAQDRQGEAQARREAAMALRSALGDLPQRLDRSPLAKFIASGVRPMVPNWRRFGKPLGAQAITWSCDEEEARTRLNHALRGLDRLQEWLLDMVHDITDQLDRIEGDPDLEPDLAGLNAANVLDPFTAWNDDREGDDDFELDTADAEPSLGSTDYRDQSRWAQGSSDDMEDEHDGREPCCEDEGAQQDAEPNLGWRNYAPDWPPTNTTLRGSPDYD